MNEKILAVWLSEALGPGSICGKKLIEEYGSFENIYRLTPRDYENIGIKPYSIVMSRLSDKKLDRANKCAAFCDHNYFGIIEYTSNMYPQRLRAIKNPPPVIYARGRMIDFDDNVCIAVVGTRSYSDTGWNSTYKITSGMASGGAVIVTGLASGIDTAATRAALDSSGFAVGVLGSGLEKIFPSENKELFEEMYQRGLVITERAPFTEITGKYFPVRNRIISGLCNAVLIGEGSTRSGAIITAAHASEQGRRIFAIPADISNPESTGVNKLIRDGAVPVFGSWDILKNYVYTYPHRVSSVPASGNVVVPEKRSTKKIRVLKGKNIAPKDKAESGAAKTVKAEPTVKSEAPVKATKIKTAAKNTAVPKRSGLVFEKVYEANMDKLKTKAEAPKPEFDIDTLGALEKKVYLCIAEKGTVVADSIGIEINEDPTNVNIALTALEMFGLIETEGAKVRKK